MPKVIDSMGIGPGSVGRALRPVSGEVAPIEVKRPPDAGLNPVVSTQGMVNVPISDGGEGGTGGGGLPPATPSTPSTQKPTTPSAPKPTTPAPAPVAGSGGGGKTFDPGMLGGTTTPTAPVAGSGGGGKTFDPNMLGPEEQKYLEDQNKPTAPSAGSAPSSGGSPAGSGSSSSSTATTSEQAATEVINNAVNSQPDEVTNYLLDEYKNLDSFYEQMKALIDSNTASLIDLSNQAIDIQTQFQLSQLAASLDQAKAQYAQERAKSLYSAEQASDNMALMNAQAGNLGGIGQKQYSDQAAQYDKALRDIDLAQIAVEAQINQSIAEAQATGDYNKLQYQLQVMADAYDQLTALAANMQEMKISTAGSLDNYYEGIREYNQNYEMQQQQLQQNMVLSKIDAGISVTEEDMAIFGLTGADAKNAAANINASQGIERQILQEQLKSLQRSNRGSSGGGGSSGSGGGDSNNGSYFSNEVPINDALAAEQAMESEGGLVVTDANGKTHTVYFGVDNATPTRAFQKGDSFTVGSRKYVYDGNQFVPSGSYSMATSDNHNGGSRHFTPGDTSNASSGIVDGIKKQATAADAEAAKYYDNLYLKYYNRIIRSNPDAYVTDAMVRAQFSASEKAEFDRLSKKANDLWDQYKAYGGK